MVKCLQQWNLSEGMQVLYYSCNFPVILKSLQNKKYKEREQSEIHHCKMATSIPGASNKQQVLYLSHYIPFMRDTSNI